MPQHHDLRTRATSVAAALRRRPVLLWTGAAVLLAGVVAIVLAVVLVPTVPRSVTGPAQGVATAIRRMPGVDSAEVAYDRPDASAPDQRDPSTWRATITAKVAPFQSADTVAGLGSEAFAHMTERQVPFSWDLWVTTTEAGTESTMTAHYADDVTGPDAVHDAAALLDTRGVVDVRVDEETTLRTRMPEDLPDAALTALAQERPVTRLTGGDDVATYVDETGEPIEVDAVELVAATAAQDAASVTYTRGSGAEASRLAVSAVSTAQVGELKTWLRAAGHADLLGHPVAFTVSGPGAEATGFVSDRQEAADPGTAVPGDAPTAPPASADTTPWAADPAAPACAGTDLKVAIAGVDAAAGSRYLLLTATNTSGVPCAVEGRPDVGFLRVSGTPPDVALTTRGAGPARVVVPAGETVRAELRWGAMSTTNGTDVTTSLLVTAVPGAEPARLAISSTPGLPASITSIDVLDGGEVEVGAWAQAIEGWS